MAQIKAGKKELFVVDDKLGTPTYTHDFARNVEILLDRELWGVFNMVCGGITSRLDVARELIKTLNLETSVQVTPVGSSFFAGEYFAARPASERLITKKLELRNVNAMREWKICLREYLNDYYRHYIDQAG
jgi:dTDP-4-dehydrorhamnose reductase